MLEEVASTEKLKKATQQERCESRDRRNALKSS